MTKAYCTLPVVVLMDSCLQTRLVLESGVSLQCCFRRIRVSVFHKGS